MSSALKGLRVQMLCQTCGRSGLHAFGAIAKPRWCRCVGTSGPIVMAPGVVMAVRFESADDAAFRERCRVLGNTERTARDALSSRWVRCGRGWRELPRTSPKRQRLERAYASARRALQAAQRECPHRDRSLFDPEMCGTCHAHVESDIEQHRHMVREGFFLRRRGAR